MASITLDFNMIDFRTMAGIAKMQTVNSIKEAIEEAETMAGCEISSVYAGIAGGHIKGFNSHGVIALKEKEVTKKLIEKKYC